MDYWYQMLVNRTHLGLLFYEGSDTDQAVGVGGRGGSDRVNRPNPSVVINRHLKPIVVERRHLRTTSVAVRRHLKTDVQISRQLTTHVATSRH